MSEIWDVHIGLQNLEGRDKSGRALRQGPQQGSRQQVGLSGGTGPVKVPCDGEVPGSRDGKLFPTLSCYYPPLFVTLF